MGRKTYRQPGLVTLLGGPLGPSGEKADAGQVSKDDLLCRC